jgi:hypothetical protein
MKMNNTTKQIGIIAIVALSFGIIDSFATSLYWRHLAVAHSAATYEANSWGIPSFHWNDESSAQTPFQESGWQKVEDALFQKKINQLGVK